MGQLALHFFPAGSRISKHVIKDGMYRRGSASFIKNSQYIVNKLWVKGGKALSEPFTQPITVTQEPIQLWYKPRGGATVIVDGQEKSVGIQHIHEPGSHDFLLNYNQQLLVPDLLTTGSGTITYRYEYPIKLLLEEPVSQKQYGIFEDIYNVNVDDLELAFEMGMRYLYKYSQPITTGRISPFYGAYKQGDVVKVEIPELQIDEYLRVQQVRYISVSTDPHIQIDLQLETPERDITDVLKDFRSRLNKLEQTVYNDTEGPLIKYIAWEGIYKWIETAGVPAPIQSIEYQFWDEQVDVIRRPVLLPADNLFPSDELYPG